MVRLARLFAPHITHLVRIAFKEPLSQCLPTTDQQITAKNKLVHWLRLLTAQHHVQLHAWSIQEEGIRLLITPTQKKELSALVQGLGRYLAAHVGQPMFQGRFQSALLESGQWVVPTMVWIESYSWQGVHHVDIDLSPWSSAGIHAGHRPYPEDGMNEHSDYWGLGNTPFDRQTSYRYLLQEGLSQAMQQSIEYALKGQWALGSDSFLERLSPIASRQVRAKPQGRPAKNRVK